MRYTPSGVPVANFSLAVSRKWNDANGQAQEKTLWFKVACWRKQAETVSQYLTKGRQVLVIGEIEEAKTFTDKAGNQRASLEVTAQTIKFLGGKGPDAAGEPASHAPPADDTAPPF